MSLPQKIGFIGTGVITDAMVRGLLAEPAAVASVLVSARNAGTAAKLAADLAAVEVVDDNQAIVDRCDTVFLAVRPQVAESVIKPLRFRDGQTVISVVAAVDRATLLDWIGAEVELAQAVPLPFVSRRKGVTAIYPRNAQAAAIFGLLGTAVECDTREEYDLLAAASAVMATYFGVMHRLTEWLGGKDLPQDKARAYLAPLFAELSQTALDAVDRHDGFIELSGEFATKGGLNEQVFRDFERHGGTAALTQALDGVLKRITG